MNKRIVLVVSIITILCVGAMTLYFISKQVPMNPDASGNIAGNLHNSGLFFEMDGKVYFSNVNDNYSLYSMNPDETKPKRLTTMRTLYISGADGFLYFYMDSTKKSGKVSGLGAATNQFGIYRCRANGKDQTCMLRDFCGQMQLCGEYVYYQGTTNGGTLNKIKLDKSEKQEVAAEAISPVCYDNGVIYYTGVKSDHSLHALYTKNGDVTSDVLSGHYFFPVVKNGYIYYMNGDSNYSLWRTSLSTGATDIITTDRLDCYTMDDNFIYYSRANADNYALMRCNLDGSNPVMMYQGVVNSLNVTSKYLYFKVYGNDNMMYHIPLDGSQGASEFKVKLDK